MRKVLVWCLAIILILAAAYGIDYYYSVIVPAPKLSDQIHKAGAADRILVFAPHPDDETIAAGGYLYNAKKAGARVEIVLATDSQRLKTRSKRRQEFIKATAQIGLGSKDLVFWGYPDGHLKRYTSVLEPKVLRIMQDYRPTMVIYPHPLDYHPDHAVLGRTIEAEMPHLAFKPLAYRYLLHNWLFRQPQKIPGKDLLFPTAGMPEPREEWLCYMLSPNDHIAKTRAIYDYNSQLNSRWDPFLKPLMLGSIRKTEIFARYYPHENKLPDFNHRR